MLSFVLVNGIRVHRQEIEGRDESASVNGHGDGTFSWAAAIWAEGERPMVESGQGVRAEADADRLAEEALNRLRAAWKQAHK